MIWLGGGLGGLGEWFQSDSVAEGFELVDCPGFGSGGLVVPDDVAADIASTVKTLTATDVDADHFTVMTHDPAAQALRALVGQPWPRHTPGCTSTRSRSSPSSICLLKAVAASARQSSSCPGAMPGT